MNKAALKSKITKALRKGVRGKKKPIQDLLPDDFTPGKVYEAYVLALICQRLKNREGLTLTLVGSKKIVLKSSPGPINNAYPHIRVTRQGAHIGDIWTDVEFTSLSASVQPAMPLNKGHYHELDLLFTTPKCSPRPLPEQILLGVECKNTGYQKSLLREILGVRRELSFLSHDTPTAFSQWPRVEVPADPPSCLAVYSSDANVLSFSGPGLFFGIDFYHEPL